MLASWLLIEIEDDVDLDGVTERVRSKSLSNAKQLVLGTESLEMMVHVRSMQLADLNAAVGEFGEIDGVKSVSTLHVRSE